MAGRHRSFMAVFYPESAPEDFRARIDSWNVKALMVLHDSDEGKKPHYHLLLMFSSMKTLQQVHKLTDELGSKTVEPVWDTKASARYLRHLDNPEKVQYPLESVEAFSGACAAELTAPVVDPGAEIRAFIREQGIVSYAELMTYCDLERPEWSKWAESHTIHLLGVLRSRDWEGRSGR